MAELADVVDIVRARDARIVGVTGGVAAGKSTFAAALAAAQGDTAVVATDGFLLTNAALAERGLSARKGFPETFDAGALVEFVERFRADGRAAAPVYSHLAYDVVPGAHMDVAGERLVLEGLHLGHPALGLREHLDLIVQLDADDADLERWYLARFRELRDAAAEDPAAFLHPYRDMPAELVEGMALDVWSALNLVVLHEEVRPWSGEADVVVRFGADHEIASLEVRPG